jgi:hypothetical protein
LPARRRRSRRPAANSGGGAADARADCGEYRAPFAAAGPPGFTRFGEARAGLRALA